MIAELNKKINIMFMENKFYAFCVGFPHVFTLELDHLITNYKKNYEKKII